MHQWQLTIGQRKGKIRIPISICQKIRKKSNKTRITYRNVGILLRSASSTVTSPLIGAWFASISCFIADILMLKSLWISVLPRTLFRSVAKKSIIVSRLSDEKCSESQSATYLATIAPNFDTMLIQFQLI